jgi:hypothetical protein
MKEWLLLLNRNDANAFSVAEFSFQLLVGKQQCSFTFVNEARDAALWVGVSLENRKIGLLAFFRVQSISEFTDEYGPAGYLILGDKLRSFQLERAPNFESLAIEQTKDFRVGLIQELNTEIGDIFRNRALAFKTGFSGLRKDFLQRLHPDGPVGSDEFLARQIMHKVLRYCASNEVIRSPAHRNFSVFVSASLQVAASMKPGLELRLNSLLQRLDPFSRWTDSALPPAKPRVDLLFTLVRPTSIFARTFLAASRDRDLDKELGKTQLAEERHQDILREISESMIKLGIDPYESESIDLMATIDGTPYIFEIKSATPENFVVQAAKGIFQLLLYSVAMEKEGCPPISVLILEKSGTPAEAQLIFDVSKKAGVRLLLFVLGMTWPTSKEDILSI